LPSVPGRALDALEDLHLGTVHLADAVVARLDLLRVKFARSARKVISPGTRWPGVLSSSMATLADAHVREVGDRDVDLHVLIGGIEQRQQRRAGLGSSPGQMNCVSTRVGTGGDFTADLSCVTRSSSSWRSASSRCWRSTSS
jgi:hypothetical protein